MSSLTESDLRFLYHCTTARKHRSEIMLTYRFFEAERSADRSERAFDWPEGRGPRGGAGQGGAVQGHVCY